MIPLDYITQWRTHAPWQQISQVEQDMIDVNFATHMRREDVELWEWLNIKNSYIFCRFFVQNQVALTCYCFLWLLLIEAYSYFIGLYGGQVLQVGKIWSKTSDLDTPRNIGLMNALLFTVRTVF